MAQYEGELAWPERFDQKFDRDISYEIGDYGYASQYQQSPVPRKGGILKREYWMDYLPTREGKFPDMDFVCVSVDSSFTEKEENDPNGCTTWGIFWDQDDMPKVMLLSAWRKHLPIHAPTQPPKTIYETKEAYAERCKPHWVYAPQRSDMVKSEMALFPKGRYKDLTDSATQALKWMRVRGLIQRPEDIALLAEARQEYRRKPVVLYRA
jgi:hypothetical protein